MWENLVVSEVRKRVLATGHPPPLWFWRTAHGDELDLLVEIEPERFVAIECKTAERVTGGALKSLHRLAGEYGPSAIAAARVACRTDRAYPLEGPSETQAVPLAGKHGLLSEVAALTS